MNIHDGLHEGSGLGFDGDWQKIETAMVKTFTFEGEAHLYAAQLRAAGIVCFIAESSTSNLTPFVYGNIRLFVRKVDCAEAMRIIADLDKQEAPEEDFREATREDIEYERRKHELPIQISSAGYVVLLLVLALFVSGWLMRIIRMLF